MEKELEMKQNYLREEIIEKGYDPNMFTLFLEEIKGDCAYDLNNWTMQELKEQVGKFILSASASASNNGDSVNSTNDKGNNSHHKNNLNISEVIKEEYSPLASSQLPLASPEKEKEKETLQCKMQIKGFLNNIENISMTISNPELIKAGLFSFAYYQFTISSNELQSKCTRKLSDFEWFRAKLVELYPGIFIPPFPPSSYFETSASQDKINKKQRTMNKFIDSLLQNELIRSSKLFTDFITLPQDQFEETKKDFNKTGAPKSIVDLVTLDGYLDISISEEKDHKAVMIANDFTTKCALFNNLTTSIKNLFNEFTVLSNKFTEVSKAFDSLTQAYSDTAHCESIQTFLLSLTNMTDQWSQGYLHQRQFFKEEVKEFFKYMSKELNQFESLYTEFNTARSYYNEYVIAAIDINKNKTTSLKQEVTSSKRYYGFLLNRFINEYDRINQLHSDRIIKQFLQFNDKKNTLLSDYINLLNFLSGSN